MSKPKVDHRHSMFPKEYVLDFNATKAAIRCGYSKRSARQIGSRLLSKDDVQKAIKKLVEKTAEHLQITREEWLDELIIATKFDPAHIYNLAEGGELSLKSFKQMGRWRRGIAEIREDRVIKESADGKDSNIVSDKRTLKFVPKLEAAKIVGQHLGFLKDPKITLAINARLSLNEFKKSMKELSE